MVEGLFALDRVMLKAVPAPAAGGQKPPAPAAGAQKQAVEATLRRLRRDGADDANALADDDHAYHDGEISLRYLEQRAPFLAREMRRQGNLREGDV
jgi:hypothetical protein